MCRRDIVDELHNEDGLADTCAAEKADLTALCVRANQIDNLDTGLQNFRCRRLLLKRGRGAVNAAALRCFHGRAVVDRLTEQVKDAAEARIADRHRNRAV